MATALAEDTRLAIRRVYPQAAAELYAAWTDPEQLKHWMAPSDDYIADVTIDLRVGGRYRVVMHAEGLETHRVGGVYRAIVANRRLVFTWAWESTPDRESLVTVEFRPDGQGTELLVTHERFADREARDRHHAGWEGCLARFARFLDSQPH